MAADRRPPIPPGPWLVVGLERSGAACARALWSRGEPVIGVAANDMGDEDLWTMTRESVHAVMAAAGETVDEAVLARLT